MDWDIKGGGVMWTIDYDSSYKCVLDLGQVLWAHHRDVCVIHMGFVIVNDTIRIVYFIGFVDCIIFAKIQNIDRTLTVT